MVSISLRRRSRKFFQGGPTLTYNCGSAPIWKIRNIGDIKLCKFQGGGPAPPLPTPPLDPHMSLKLLQLPGMYYIKWEGLEYVEYYVNLLSINLYTYTL